MLSQVNFEFKLLINLKMRPFACIAALMAASAAAGSLGNTLAAEALASAST